MTGSPSWRGRSKGLHRFYVPEAFADPPGELPAHLLHQLRNVLRLRAGERLVVFDGNGKEAIAQLLLQGRHGYLVVTDMLEVEPPRPCMILLQSLIRPTAFDLVLQKATELGVTVIQPVVSRRSLPQSTSPQKLQRWHRIAVEAAEQCGRAHLPKIEPPVHLEMALKEWASGLSLIAYEAEAQTTLASAVQELRMDQKVTMVIGPEGGFEDEEVRMAAAMGYRPVSLGPWRLRSETAAIAALAAIMMAALK
jgi:16S rRNA (uracil1498-N3)-methyltransferase